LRRNITLLAALVLALPLFFADAIGAQESPARQASQEPKPAQDSKAQDNKPAPQSADKRELALKKYLDAQRLEQANNFPGAVAAYKEAIALDPQSAELRISLGALYLRSRNVIDAEAQAHEAIKLAPDSIDSRKLLARVYIAQSLVGTSVDKEKAQAAIKELEEVVKINPSAKIEVGDQEMPALTVIGRLYLSLDEEEKALNALKRVAEGDSSSDEAQFQLALLYYQKNKIREAAAAARKAYDLKPQTPQYAGLLAKIMTRMGRTQEALDIYEKAIGIKKGEGKPEEGGKEALLTSPLLFDYAETLVSGGRYDEATRLLEPVLKLVRKDHPSYLNAVKITVDSLRRSGKREEAVRTLEEALKGQDVSESLPVLFSLAETYEEMQQFDKAIETYEEALGALVNPDGTVSGAVNKQNSGIIMRRIAIAHRMAGKRDKMMETFERMRKVLGDDSPLADQLIIDSLLNEGKNQEALDRATQAATRFPDERSFKFYRAQAAGKLGDLPTAETVMKSLLKNGPEDSDIYSFLSYVQLEANHLKQAEETVRKAVELDPSDIGTLITLSTIQERQKKYKESEATLRKALEIDPENATVLNNLGYFLADRSDRFQEAEDLIRRAVNIEPTNGSYLDSLGWVLFKRGKIDEAQKYLEQAVVYSPRSATIQDHLGDLYKKQGNAEKARAKWEEALRLANEPEEIKKIKEKLGKK
jgi:tetratricopeptide (TPR) repeat protein